MWVVAEKGDKGTGEEAEALVAVAAEEGQGMVVGREGDGVGQRPFAILARLPFLLLQVMTTVKWRDLSLSGLKLL
ncbi:hypothetical protein ACH5RR_003674 [Cinchona calisaya]|uniref:Uncharacterized protein n=1 Tax=Cinchona calisaya TaxID=153742 RepID=A0ABD3AVP7_9GENT